MEAVCQYLGSNLDDMRTALLRLAKSGRWCGSFSVIRRWLRSRRDR